MRRWCRAGVVAATLMTFGGSWAMGMAIADPGPPRLVLTDVGSQTHTPISVSDLYPGLAVTHPLEVALTPNAPQAGLALTIDGLVDLERDCNHPETTSGDLTCGEDEGELSEQLLLHAALTAGGSCDDRSDLTRVLAPTPLRDVASAGLLDLDAALDPGAQRCLLLTFDLPTTADNLVQTDLARFDLTVRADQVLPDESGVGGVTTGAATGASSPAAAAPTGAGGALPATGTDATRAALVALALLAGGHVVLRGSRRRQASAHTGS